MTRSRMETGSVSSSSSRSSHQAGNYALAHFHDFEANEAKVCIMFVS